MVENNTNQGIKFEIHPILNKMRVNPIASNGVGYFFKCNNGDKLFYRIWKSLETKKILIGIHGMAAHSEYYVQVADQMIDKNITVIAVDLKHHGRSTGKKGDLKSFEELINQLYEFITWVRSNWQGIPIYLMGISMGGCISVNYAVNYANTINGMILVAPAVKLNMNFSLLDILKLPLYGIIYLFNKGATVISVHKKGANLGTRNPLRIEYDENDEYRIKKVSLRYLLQLRSWIVKAYNNAETIEIPVLIIQGTEDKLVSINGVKEFYQKLKSKDKQFIELKGAYHSLYSDPAMVEQNGWLKLKEWIIQH
ncbi:MAG: alpha/beta fold hydrolase [Candidatus Helarchaeota archaeon]